MPPALTYHFFIIAFLGYKDTRVDPLGRIHLYFPYRPIVLDAGIRIVIPGSKKIKDNGKKIKEIFISNILLHVQFNSKSFLIFFVISSRISKNICTYSPIMFPEIFIISFGGPSRPFLRQMPYPWQFTRRDLMGPTSSSSILKLHF